MVCFGLLEYGGDYIQVCSMSEKNSKPSSNTDNKTPRKIQQVLASTWKWTCKILKWPALIAVPCLVFAGTAWWSMLSSLSNEVQQVPDLRGKPVEEARFILASRGLNLVLEEREIHSQEIARGDVIETNPASGAKIKRGRNVHAFLSAGIKTRLVPNLLNKSAVAAQMLGRQQGFTVRSAGSIYSEAIPVGHVIAQNPEPNTAFIARQVEILISKGEHPRLISMPDVVGRPLLSVLQELKRNNLPVVVRRRGESADISNNEEYELRQYTIYRQYPDAGSFINLGNPEIVILRVEWSN